ncbi:MAG: hypothetical protein CMI28_01640 [Opitutae bacterium]|nr:hypothetical protein [Opitutae bacterium]
MNTLREFKFISQKFDRPHISSNFSWEIRESIVLRELNDNGEFVYGEIAPVPGFPFQPQISDVLVEAEKWAAYQKLLSSSLLAPALSCMKSDIWKINIHTPEKKITKSILVPFDNVKCCKPSLKIKIGLLPVVEEIEKTKAWLQRLDISSKVRLDANGALSMDELKLWNDQFSTEKRIEYLEQPVSDEFRDVLFDFSNQSNLPLAIDETIVAMGSPYTAKDNGWNGFYVIKPTLLPDWNLTLKFAKENPAKTVFSTVYESPFGYEALVRASVFSELEAGINRENLKSQTKEFPSHHVEMLESPSATTRELNELWAKFD